MEFCFTSPPPQKTGIMFWSKAEFCLSSPKIELHFGVKRNFFCTENFLLEYHFFSAKDQEVQTEVGV